MPLWKGGFKHMEEEQKKSSTDTNKFSMAGSTPVAPPSPPTSPSATPTPPSTPVVSAGGGKSKKMLWIVIAAVLVVAVAAAGLYLMSQGNGKKNDQASTDGKKTTLVMAVHWLEKQQIEGITKDGKLESKGLRQYLEEYEKLHPEIRFSVQQIPYNEYASKLKVLSDSGAAPDIYQIYSAWGASYVKDGILAEPPEDVMKDVEANYVSTAGVTIDGKMWGIPTEVNNYALLYNKDMYKAAGIVDASGNAKAPTTWQEVLSNAKKLTKKDSKNVITQYGFAALRDNDWQSVDPFLSLLFSNAGSFLSSDLTKSVFNSAAGVQALDAQVQLFKDGSTDTNGNFYDFGKNKVAQVVSPPWTKANFASDFGDKFEATVGVAPLPYLKAPGTLQYSWFAGVMKGSTHQKEAWDFLKWFSSDVQSSGTTRYGDLLAETIGAIPGRKVDFDGHKETLGDFFTSVYVKQMKDSTAEPNVLQLSDMKKTLMDEIQATWDGKKTSQQALDSAATAIDKILAQYYKQ